MSFFPYSRLATLCFWVALLAAQSTNAAVKCSDLFGGEDFYENVYNQALRRLHKKYGIAPERRVLSDQFGLTSLNDVILHDQLSSQEEAIILDHESVHFTFNQNLFRKFTIMNAAAKVSFNVSRLPSLVKALPQGYEEFSVNEALALRRTSQILLQAENAGLPSSMDSSEKASLRALNLAKMSTSLLKAARAEVQKWADNDRYRPNFKYANIVGSPDPKLKIVIIQVNREDSGFAEVQVPYYESSANFGSPYYLPDEKILLEILKQSLSLAERTQGALGN